MYRGLEVGEDNPPAHVFLDPDLGGLAHLNAVVYTLVPGK